MDSPPTHSRDTRKGRIHFLMRVLLVLVFLFPQFKTDFASAKKLAPQQNPTIVQQPISAETPLLQRAAYSGCSAVTEISLGECDALVALYNSTNGPSWTDHAEWLSTDTPCSWYGVTCTAGKVTGLELWGNNLAGTIPSAIGNLINLTSLNLKQNQLTGSIPAQVGNLVRLTYLGLSNNQLSGTIPVEIGNLTNLVELDLAVNKLTGSIPGTIGNLNKLTRLQLNSNQLSGIIPVEIGNLVAIQELFLSNNKLTSSIPTQIGNLTGLTSLGLNSNSLAGSIPAQIGNLTNLRNLWLSSNQLSGSLPVEIGNLSNLTDLLIGNNQLTGAIPTQIGGLSSLSLLSLEYNQLSGPIPTEIGNLRNLQYLNLFNNLLTSIPASIGGITNLVSLSLENNQLTGGIPATVGSLANLQSLVLSNNQLSGAIPVELGLLSKLTGLYLSKNQLTGNIPKEIGNLGKLKELQVETNQLVGIIPADLTKLTGLTRFYYSGTGLCAPADTAFQAWLNAIGDKKVTKNCSIMPVLNSITPVYSFVGGPTFNLTLNGSSFMNISSAKWGGTALKTTFNTSTKLSAEVPASLLTAPSQVSVTVYTPDLGGGTSSAKTHTVIGYSPRYDEELIAKKVTFNWDDIPGATQYTIQFSTSNTFSTLIVNTTTTTSAYAYDVDLTDNSTYYWRIRPLISGSWGAWSHALRFYSLRPPAAPKLNQPVGGLITNDTTPEFSWNAVTKGDHYQIQVSKTSSFNSTVINQTLGTGILVYAHPSAISDGIYYWRVRAYDTNGAFGAWSSTRSFTIDTVPPAATTLISPVDKSVIRGTPKYSWNPVVGMASYRFLYSTNPDCSSPAYSSDPLTTTSHTPPTQPIGTYYWCVKTFDTAGNASTSPRFEITIKPLIPAKPSLSSPPTGTSTSDTTPTLAWKTVPYGVNFQVQVSNSSAFSSTAIVHTLETPALTLDVPALPDGKYYWRVRAQNQISEWGSWSGYRTITVDTLPPSPPTLLKPANKAVVLTQLPKLEVSPVAGGVKYRFQVSASDSFSVPLVDVTKAAPDYSLTSSQVLPFGTIYWRVKSIDAAGNESAWSTSGIFDVTFLKNPANNSYTLNTKPAFSWLTVSGALEYRIQVDETIAFTDSLVMDVYRTPSTTYTPTTALAYGKYYWRMQVRKASGWGTWTPPFRFTISPPLPVAPALTSPSGGYYTNDSTPSFNWNSAVNGVYYQFQISKKTSFSTRVQDAVLGNGIMNYTVTPLTSSVYYWRVRAFNYLDVPGAWSSYRTITVDLIQPAAPKLSSPADGTTYTGTPKYVWLASAGAKYYEFSYSTDSSFATSYTSPVVATLSYTPPAQSANTYYWRVRARDLAGNWSPWSVQRKIIIK